MGHRYIRRRADIQVCYPADKAITPTRNSSVVQTRAAAHQPTEMKISASNSQTEADCAKKQRNPSIAACTANAERIPAHAPQGIVIGLVRDLGEGMSHHHEGEPARKDCPGASLVVQLHSSKYLALASHGRNQLAPYAAVLQEVIVAVVNVHELWPHRLEVPHIH